MADTEDRNELDELLGDMKKLSVAEESAAVPPVLNYAQYDPVSGRMQLMQSLGVPAEPSEENSRRAALILNPDAEGWMLRDVFAPPGVRDNWAQWERYMAMTNNRARVCDLRQRLQLLALPLPVHPKKQRAHTYVKMLPLGVTPCFVAALGQHTADGSFHLLYVDSWPMLRVPTAEDPRGPQWVQHPYVALHTLPSLVAVDDQWLSLVVQNELLVYEHDNATFQFRDKVKLHDNLKITAVCCNDYYRVVAGDDSTLTVLLANPYAPSDPLAVLNRRVFPMRRVETDEQLSVQALRLHPLIPRLLYVYCSNGQMYRVKLALSRRKRAAALVEMTPEALCRRELQHFYQSARCAQVVPTPAHDLEDYNHTKRQYKHGGLEAPVSLQVVPALRGAEKSKRTGNETVLLATAHAFYANLHYTFDRKPLTAFDDNSGFSSNYMSAGIPNELDQLHKRDMPKPNQCAAMAGNVLALHVHDAEQDDKCDFLRLINVKNGQIISTLSLNHGVKTLPVGYHYQSLLITPSRIVLLNTLCQLGIVDAGVTAQDIADPAPPTEPAAVPAAVAQPMDSDAAAQ